MQKITHKELVEKLNQYRGVTFISCSIESPVKMAKGGRAGRAINPYHEQITKASYLNGAIGFDYEKSVNNQRGKEGVEEVFESKPRAWGTVMEGGKFVEHKGNFYLQLKVENVGVDSVQYFNEGQAIDPELLTEWLPKKREGSGRQDVENEIILRDIKLASIKSIKFGKEEYEVTE